MIIRFLKNNKQFSIIFYLLLGAILWAHRFYNPIASTENNVQLSLFEGITRFFSRQGGYSSIIVAFLLMIVLAFLFDLITKRFRFDHNKTPLTGVLYIIILGGFIDFHYLHPVYLSGILLSILIFKLFLLVETENVESTLFQIGIFYSFSLIIYVQSIVLLPFLAISILLIKCIEAWRSIVVFLLGLLLPFIFIFSTYYLFDIDFSNNIIESCNLKIDVTQKLKDLHINFSLALYLIFILTIMLISTSKIIHQFPRKKIVYRNYYSIFFLSFISPILGYFFVPCITKDILLLSIIPMNFIIANFLYYNKNQNVNSAILIVLFLLALFIQLSFYV